MIGDAEQRVVQTEATFVTAGTLNTLTTDPPTCWDLVKVDVEGWETEILPQIARIPFHYLVIEIRPRGEDSLTPEQVTETLANHGRPCTIVSHVGGRSQNPDNTVQDLLLASVDSIQK